MMSKNTAENHPQDQPRKADVVDFPGQHDARPKNPLPAQHQERPGLQKDMHPQPQWLAPDYKGSDKLKDKAVLVTGGDSGIGRSVAVLAAREGADVAVVYLPEEQPDADETRRAIEAEGRRCVQIPGDVTDPRFCIEAVERTVRELGKIDVLVNNAAFQQSTPDIEQLSDEQFDRTFKTNIYGYFRMAKAAIRHMKPGSAIVNTSSETALEGSKSLLDYSATKGAISAFTKALAQQMAPRGIRVNAVAPGPIWTPLNVVDSDPKGEKVTKFGSQTPMQRPGQPEEVAPAYIFLASNITASYISGEVLRVMGGETTAG